MGSKGQGFVAPTNGRAPAGESAVFVSGSSPSMLTLQGIIGEIAPTNIPVLLVGEIGTGKQMFAERIHHLSLRHQDALVTVACAGVNPESLEVGVRRSTEITSCEMGNCSIARIMGQGWEPFSSTK